MSVYEHKCVVCNKSFHSPPKFDFECSDCKTEQITSGSQVQGAKRWEAYVQGRADERAGRKPPKEFSTDVLGEIWEEGYMDADGWWEDSREFGRDPMSGSPGPRPQNPYKKLK